MSPHAAPKLSMERATTNTPPGHDDAPPLTIAVNRAEQSLRVDVSGELDLDTVPGLQDALETALATMPQQLTLDFRRLDFIDSAGLALLIELHGRFRNPPPCLTLLVSPAGQVREVLELSRFDQFFSIDDGDPVPGALDRSAG